MPRPPNAHTFRAGIEGKVCPACDTWHPLVYFAGNVRASDGLQSSCRECGTRKNKRTPSTLAAKERAARKRIDNWYAFGRGDVW